MKTFQLQKYTNSLCFSTLPNYLISYYVAIRLILGLLRFEMKNLELVSSLYNFGRNKIGTNFWGEILQNVSEDNIYPAT